MQYGMYISASGVSASMARQDVISNNLANVNTVGFKPDVLGFRARLAERMEKGLVSLPSNDLLEKLGGGVTTLATKLSMAQGPMVETGRRLDAAIQGNGFFVTRAPGGQGEAGVRLTRDGRMAVGADGTLVNAASGFPLLSGGSPIRVDAASALPVEIGADGTVRQGSSRLGKLDVATVPDPSSLIKDRNGLLSPGGQSVSGADGQVQQGFVEQSGVDAVRAMIDVTGASNAAQSGLAMISYYSDMMSRAIQSLGRVA